MREDEEAGENISMKSAQNKKKASLCYLHTSQNANERFSLPCKDL